ncbi:baseplate central spike complex protein [Vibrio phage phi50-12]|uniref:Lysozyme n=1 Tax=Vibrio phage phi50-12 TaxID=2654972 RepID=A0A5P8PRF3_9CAUD|nr:baseplate central spike complex protein [Vibrio phage phi50-12]QFR59853.1 baseplate central spike complex protein [Vibrio phage phi50-12]
MPKASIGDTLMKHLLALLEYEESYREKAYYCSAGYPTIGIGKKIGPKAAPLHFYQFTCSKELAYLWLDEEVAKVQLQLVKYDWYNKQSDDRKTILISMAYQMGVEGLLKFRKMIAALKAGNFYEARMQALDSKWYRDTPLRAKRHAQVLETGDLLITYNGLLG